MFIPYEKELDESNQKTKSYENYIGDDKIKNDVLNKVFEKNMTENVNSEKDEIEKHNPTNRFIDILNNNERELQSKNFYCGNN